MPTTIRDADQFLLDLVDLTPMTKSEAKALRRRLDEKAGARVEMVTWARVLDVTRSYVHKFFGGKDRWKAKWVTEDREDQELEVPADVALLLRLIEYKADTEEQLAALRQTCDALRKEMQAFYDEQARAIEERQAELAEAA